MEDSGYKVTITFHAMDVNMLRDILALVKVFPCTGVQEIKPFTRKATLAAVKVKDLVAEVYEDLRVIAQLETGDNPKEEDDNDLEDPQVNEEAPEVDEDDE